MLDLLGRILSCGAPSEKLFGGSQVRLMGRNISEFIGRLLPGARAPSYDASYIDHLCADGEWRQFEAQDVGGRWFTVELNLSRMITSSHEIFLLNVCRVDEGASQLLPPLPPDAVSPSFIPQPHVDQE
jgi:PAS domain-containing protein